MAIDTTQQKSKYAGDLVSWASRAVDLFNEMNALQKRGTSLALVFTENDPVLTGSLAHLDSDIISNLTYSMSQFETLLNVGHFDNLQKAKV